MSTGMQDSKGLMPFDGSTVAAVLALRQQNTHLRSAVRCTPSVSPYCPAPPARLAQIAMLLMEDEDSPTPCPSLRYILSAGEALTASLARQVAHVLPHVALVNAYGPTEATVYITHHTYEPREANARPTVSIGKPLTNSRCYIVDQKHVSL